MFKVIPYNEQLRHKSAAIARVIKTQFFSLKAETSKKVPWV